MEDGQDKNQFNEHKIILGFQDGSSALKAYQNSYPNGGNVLSVRETDVRGIKSWLSIGNVYAPA